MPYAFDPSVGLGLLAFMRGDYAEAQRLLDQVLLTSEPVRHLVNLESAYYVLAGLQFALGTVSQSAAGRAGWIRRSASLAVTLVHGLLPQRV